ncbi:MAG TPA: hypothetical protein VHX14_11600 [Thermoanaerobaculia bacterium]|jgi:hypothetical protein|nr:hypothetical protein [Thermoanaerobaculia bacterium]
MIVLAGVAFFYLGAQLAARIHNSEELTALERASSTALLGTSLWIAVNWLLSVPHWLNRPALLSIAAAAIVAAIILRRPGTVRTRPSAIVLLCLLPLAGWIAFLLWRAWVLPIGSADALIYHMPRAVMFWKAGGYSWFPNVPDFRINGVAANYELLLADVLAIQGRDTIAEWMSVLFFVLLLIVSTALARRWWGKGRYLVAVPYLIASIPLVVLHAGAIKNDLMSHFFALSALLWAGRWFSSRRFPDAALCVIALFAGAGTKNHLLLLVAILGLLFLMGRPTFRFLLRLSLVAAASFLFLGGVHYFFSIRHSGCDGVAPAQYGEWGNLIRFPLDIFSAPFSSSDTDLVLPWTDTPTPWYRYDVYSSHYGQLVSIALILMPVLLWAFRRRDDGAPPKERYVVLASGSLFFLLMMPIQAVPSGLASYFPRYLLSVAVLVLWATIVPLYSAIERKLAGRKAMGVLALVAAIVLPLLTIADYAARDKWMPFNYVAAVAHRHGARLYPPIPVRAAMVVDRLAGPTDRIEIHGGHDTYLYPAYGISLSRDLHFIGSAAEIRPDAPWVAIDRADNIFWHHPAFKSAGDWRRYWGQGTPSPEDVSVLQALARDSRYQLVYYSPRFNQAVFRRIQ